MKDSDTQMEIIRNFESKLPRTRLSERLKAELVNLLWESVHQANEKRSEYWR